MNDFRFAEPGLVHAVWGVILLGALLLALELRSGGALDRWMSRTLQERLVARARRPRRILRTLFLALAAFFLVVALMRPQLGITFVSTPRVGARVMVCLDVSRSMLAEDAVPNRLERAKAEIRDLLPLLEGDQVGLIAFAGRAAVLCPMTPDFSFFRLVLDGVTANCVGKGGTRLEDPIRKAMEAFGEGGDAARAIFLVSDGEDHDSFPLEACDEAKERGIQVIAIGFGDEGGSPVVITDPGTGVKSPLRDREGNIVRSRLDGETLREMALRTEGLYIPAGTASLDLAAIHEQAIEPLMRGRIEGTGRSVRREAYQWPALAALACLVASALATAQPRAPLPLAAALVISALLVSPASSVRAQEPGDAAGSAPAGTGVQDPAEPERVAEPGSPSAPDPDAGLPARLLHNRALLDLETGELAAARRRLERAESEAGLDAELRFRARYHLGWVAVREADAQLAESPEEALASLERAAGHFRDAVRVRPEGTEARKNLEIVLRRIRQLSDSLRAREETELATRLDAIIERQRGILAEARSLLERDVADPASAEAEPRRREYLAVAATERELLADLEALASDAEDERRGLASAPDAERTPESRLREAQLGSLLAHLTRAEERLGQSHHTLRRRQGDRASRRASLALSALKRAREQLRDPLQVLDGIIPDARASLRQGLELLAASAPVFDPAAPRRTPPPWLDAASLGEDATEIAERVGELAERFRGAASARTPDFDPADPEAVARARLLDLVRAALPHLDGAAGHYGTSGGEYAAERVRPGFEAGSAGLAELFEARELFLDTKGLIELIWQDEGRVLALLRGDDGADEAGRRERVPALAELHGKNRGRLDRLRGLLDDEEAELARSAPPGETPAGAPPPEELEALRQRLAIARELLGAATAGADAAAEWFGAQAALPPEEISLDSGIERVDATLPPLEALRRLYFTIVEHLRDAARRQQDLCDSSADAVAQSLPAPEETARRLAPLEPEQEELRRLAAEIAPALAAQGSAAGQVPAPAGGAAGDGGTAAAAQSFARAAELVESAAGEMQRALDTLFAEPPEIEAGTSAQRAALERLVEALFLLEPPQPDSEPDEHPPEEDPESGEEPRQEPRREPVDPAQLLQAVRDREAKRRAEQQRVPGEDPTVEKDW